jgi:branched-chain amino acid transport system ATP-binding protein
MLEVSGLEVFYNEFLALRGISFGVREGELVTIIGAHGAGKTTILRCLMGLVRCSRGEIVFEGENITRTPPHHRARRGISLVPEGRKIFPDLTVMENLLMGAYTQQDRKIIQAQLEKAFHLFPVLRDRQNQIGKTLSGGEQQMLAIGRALMANPDIILMDEPSEGLAPVVVRHIGEIMKNLQEQGHSILLVEQNFKLAMTVADQVFIISSGRIVHQALPAELEKQKEILDRYLGI